MGKLIAYNFITLNGFYKGLNEDISWHSHGKEEGKYSEDMLALNNILVFGRKTYDQMVSFWPTPTAKEMFPKVANGMNIDEKIVITNRALPMDFWGNSKVINGDVIEQIKNLKQTSIKDMAILGSGSIINFFTGHGLIDEYQIMIDPVVIGNGTPIFNGLNQNLNLKLSGVRTFESGVVLLCYNLN